ncbi:MAG: sensor domain-containing protein [Mycobacterium sp.]
MRQLQTAVAIAAAGLLITACGGGGKGSGPASSTAKSTTTTATRPPVAQPALDGLLLTADEVNAAMGTSGLTLLPQNGTAMQDDYDKKWPPDCFFASSSAENPAYAGSGFTAVRLQVAATTSPPTDQSVAPPSATTGLVLFPSGNEASAFFTTSSQRWAACADRQFTVPPEKPEDPEQRFQTTPLTNANGVLSLTLTGTAVGAGINSAMTCQRALSVRNNVAIDITTCGKDPGTTAVTIANQIGGKVDKL